MTLEVRGIATCDTCRRARKWLDEQGIAYRWMDLREQPPDESRLERWLQALGAEALLNRRSATWRMLRPEQRPAPDSPGLAAALLANPTLIRRPVFERDGEVRVGFGDTVRAWLEQG